MMRNVPRAVLIHAVAVVLSSAALAVPTVTIKAPTTGASVSTSVQVAASATSSQKITLTQVYVDGVKKYEVSGATVSTSLSLTSGSHKLTVQSYDASGTGKTSVSFTAATTSTPPLATYTDIDQMTNWASCDKCAGAGGNGPVTAHSLTQLLASPSMDGASAQFTITPSVKYAAALWWKQLGAQPTATKFTYDLYFYLKNPNASQALEFDANQTLNGLQYVMGTECNIKGSKQWDVWDDNLHWVHTGIPCTVPTAYTWHHLVWEFARTSDHKTQFISVTLDGVKSYVNKSLTPRTKSGAELNVAVQLDGNSTGTAYSEWVDNIKLTIW